MSPWPPTPSPVETARKHLCPQRTWVGTSWSFIQRGKLYLWFLNMLTFHLRNITMVEVASPAALASSSLPVLSSTLLNCNECQWSGKTQRVLTRHIRASHPKDFIPWSETTPLILWFLLWWTYFKWLTSRTNKKKHKNLSCRTLNVPDEE